jgi:hypothetical protein
MSGSRREDAESKGVDILGNGKWDSSLALRIPIHEQGRRSRPRRDNLYLSDFCGQAGDSSDSYSETIMLVNR